MDIGKRIRLERIIDRNTGNALIVPMDHGVRSGPEDGLTDLDDIVNEVAAGGATAVLMHKGMVERGHRGSGHDIGLIINLTASTCHGPRPRLKGAVCTVDEAVRLGADAVFVRILVGTEDEMEFFSDLGAISSECSYSGLPLIVAARPGWKVSKEDYPQAVAHCARVAADLGADIVNVDYTGDVDSFRKVVENTGAPVIVSCGPDTGTDREVLAVVHDAMQAGCHGVSIGRNIFRHRNVQGMTRAISEIVMMGSDVKESLKNL